MQGVLGRLFGVFFQRAREQGFRSGILTSNLQLLMHLRGLHTVQPFHCTKGVLFQRIVERVFVVLGSMYNGDLCSGAINFCIFYGIFAYDDLAT